MNRRWLSIVIALMLALSLVLPGTTVRAEEQNQGEAPSNQVSAKVDIRIEGYKGTVANVHDFVATGDSVVTAADVTLQALEANNIPNVYSSGYFQSINGEADSELSVASGWLYKVNGMYPDVYAQDFEIKDGDEIVWHYTNFSALIENMEYPGMLIGSGVDTVDKVTFEPIIDMPTTAVAGEPITIKVTGNYSVVDFSFNTLQSNLTANLDQVTIAMNGKQYVTDVNGEATIPAEDAISGTYELKFTKDLSGTMLVYMDEKTIPSYPRIIRTYKELTIQEPLAPSHRERVEQALEKGKSYFLTEKSLVNTHVNESHSGYWMLSAMYAAGVDVSNYPWLTAPTSPDTFWTKIANKAAGSSNEDAGTIIGSTILGLDPTNLKSRNIVEDLVAKQKPAGIFSTIWGESWAMVALDLVNGQYNQEAHINAILNMQNATTSYFGDVDATGWMLFALAPHRDQPAVEEAIQKAVASYNQSFKTKGFTDNANTMAAIISGLASVGEDLFSDKWTYEKDGKEVNIVSYLADNYQLADGGIRWKAADTKSNLMALEQVYIAFSDALHQKSTFVRLKDSLVTPSPSPSPSPTPSPTPGPGGENPGNGNENNQTVTTYTSIHNGSGYVLNTYEADVPADATAYSVLQTAASANGITIQARTTSMGIYVEGINGLKEFDKGPLSGWMYRVNGEFPGYSADSYTVKAGDRIEWVYTIDLGNDVGGGSVGGTGETPGSVVENKDGEMKAELSAEFIQQQLQDSTSKQIVVEDKSGIKVELPKSSIPADTAKLMITAKQTKDSFTVSVEAVNKDGKSTPVATSKDYLKVNLPAKDIPANAVILQNVDGEYRTVPHTILNGQIIIYTKTSGEFVISTEKVSFNDLDSVDNRDEIEFLAARHVVNGNKDGKFNPHGAITRGEFAAMISRALGLQATSESSFKDTAGKWYEQEIQALYVAGVTEGTSATTFDPDSPISRQQAAAFMARVLAYVSYETKEGSKVDYKDANKINTDFVEDIQMLQALGIMTGNSDGTFNPDGNLTRAQMAKILKRTLNAGGLM
ncbi:MAG: S-layer homology domain-containing protein [Candidatus Pristimantibacillus sp.]